MNGLVTGSLRENDWWANRWPDEISHEPASLKGCLGYSSAEHARNEFGAVRDGVTDLIATLTRTFEDLVAAGYECGRATSTAGVPGMAAASLRRRSRASCGILFGAGMARSWGERTPGLRLSCAGMTGPEGASNTRDLEG